jgi:micrococcal nuclease
MVVCVTTLAEARLELPRYEAIAAEAEVTVYVTKTGKKYHTATCRHLDKSKRKTTKAQAQKDGLTACKVCHPG